MITPFEETMKVDSLYNLASQTISRTTNTASPAPRFVNKISSIRNDLSPLSFLTNEEQVAGNDSPQSSVRVTEPGPPPDDQTTGYTTLFSTLFLTLFNEFEQYIYRSVSEAGGRPVTGNLSDCEMSNLLSQTPENRLRFVLENISADWQQGHFGSELRRDILTFLNLKSSLQSASLSLPVLMQLCHQLATLLSSQGSLSQILGTEVTDRWHGQLESTVSWMQNVSRIHSLPRDSIPSLLKGLFSNNLLPEWMNDLLVQANKVYHLLEQLDELALQLRPAREAWYRATTPLEKVSVFLELITDNALMESVIPYLREDYSDIASALDCGLLIKQAFFSNSTEENAPEHPATALNTLLDPAFYVALRQRVGSHPPVPWLLDTLTRTADTLQAETLSMGALRTTIRMSDPTLSWGQFLQISMGDVSVMQMAKSSLKLSASVLFRSIPWLDTLLQELLRLTDSRLWQTCSRGNIQDLPLAIIRELHDDLNSDHSRLLPLISGYLGDHMPGLLDRLNLLRQLLEAGAVGQSKSVMLALMVKSGRIGGAPDILTLIAEKTLHLSLLWRLWSAHSEVEIARLNAEFMNVLSVLPDEYIKNIGTVMQWLPLLRGVYSLTGELPALRQGESPVGWLFRLNHQLGMLKTPASQAIRKRLRGLLPDDMTLSSALLRSVNTSLSTLSAPEEQQASSSQQSLRQWLWDALTSLKLSRQTVRHILDTLANIVLTPRMAVALMIGYTAWALPCVQATEQDGGSLPAEPDPAGIPDPHQLQDEHEWTLPENIRHEDFALREQQAIELMTSEEGENYWQHLTWSSGLMALIFMSAATGIRIRKKMQRSNVPSEDVEAGIPLQDLSASALAADSNGNMLPNPQGETMRTRGVPGTFTQIKNWLRENPTEGALWTLGTGTLLPTAYSSYRWSQTQQRNAKLREDIYPTDLIITVTSELLDFLQPAEKGTVSSAVTLTGSRRTKRNATATSDGFVSSYLSTIVEAVWGDRPAKKPTGTLVYSPRYNLYINRDNNKRYLPINQGSWRVTGAEGSQIMLLHNEDTDSAIPGADQNIHTIPIHMIEGTDVWTTTFAITADINAIKDLFSWDAYSPEFIVILKKYLFQVLKKHTTIEMATVMIEMDKLLEELFLGSYTDVKLSVQILQARMELDIKIHNHKTWPSPYNDTLIRQFHDQVNLSQMDNYARAMSFEISDRSLFNEAFELSITGKNDHISDKEKSLTEDIELQEKIINNHLDNIKNDQQKIDNISGEIKKLEDKGRQFGAQVYADNYARRQSLNIEKNEIQTSLNSLQKKLQSDKLVLSLLIKNLQNYQAETKNTKQQLQNYQQGIKTAHQLISKKIPELLDDYREFKVKAANTLHFELIAEELRIYDMPRNKYSTTDIKLLQSLEAQKSYLLLMINQQKIAQQFHPLLTNVNNRQWHGSYRDIFLAMQDAKNVINNENEQRDNNYRSYLLAATIYRMRKEKHPLGVVKNYSAWKTIRIFEKDKEQNNPFTRESHPPKGFRSFSELKPSTDFDRQLDYNQQFNDYRNLYSQYESQTIIRMLFTSLGNKISVSDIFTPPKKAWCFEAYKKAGNFITIELDSGNWVFISSVNGQFAIKHYTKADFSRLTALKILTQPDIEFGYNLSDNAGYGAPTLDVSRHTYPYLKKTIQMDSKAYDPDVYREFWIDFNNNTFTPPTLIFSGNSAALTIDGDLFTVATRLLNSSLHSISHLLQQNFDDHSVMHKIAKYTLPFYDVIYKSVTDSEYKLNTGDIISIVFDSIMTLTILATAGMSITADIAAKLAAKTAGYHALGYSGRSLVYKTLAHLPKIMISRSITSIFINTMVDIIAPIPLRSIPSAIRGGIMLFSDMERLSRYPETIDKLVNTDRSISKKWQLDIAVDQLKPVSNNSRFHGIYMAKNAKPGTVLHNKNYIRYENGTYLVRWDEYTKTWRVIDPINSLRLSYQTAVKFSEGRWETHRPSWQSEPEIAEMINAEETDGAIAEPDRPITDNTGKYIQEFVPIVKRNISAKMVESSQSGKFNAFFQSNPYTVRQGFDAKHKKMANTYFPEVIPIVEKGVEFSDDIIKRALKRLVAANNKPAVMKELHAYFSGALGTTNEKIISEAVKRISTIAENSLKITEYSKNQKYQNIAISSSIRPSGSAAGSFSDTFTKETLRGKTVAFVHPGDEGNIISINGDMISVGIRDYADRSKYVGYTLLHETSHLAVATSDIKYFPTARKNTDNAEMIKKFIIEGINNKNLNTSELDKFTNQVSKVNRHFGVLDDDAIYDALKTDTMLRSNLMLSNADSVAAYLIDIADERTFDTDIPRLLEPEMPSVAADTGQQGKAKVEPPPVTITRKRVPRAVPDQEPAFNFNPLFLTLVIELAL